MDSTAYLIYGVQINKLSLKAFKAAYVLVKIVLPCERPLSALGKILYFATIMDTTRDSAHQSQNEDNFATFSLGLEFLNEAEKEKNNGNFA